MASAEIEVEFHRGVRLPELDLWLDPHDAKSRAFVSHAHADHVAPHKESICSAITKTLVEKRFSSRGELVGYEFGESFERDGFRQLLLPAGHILGSAQFYAERLSDGASLLYTGDFKLRHGASSRPAESLEADTLIMETTYGLPRYRLPPSDDVLDDLVRFLRESIEENQIPMVGAYALGKAQELLIAIGQRAPELNFVLHNSAAAMTKIYEELGHKTPPWTTLAKDSQLEGKVVIAPPSAIRSQQLRRVKNRLTAMVSGWGIDSSAKYRYQVDEVFPLSDHADYDDLIRYVELVKPKRVLTLHGFAEDFARDLRSRGWEAWALTGANQLELDLRNNDQTKPTKASVPKPEKSATGFSKFVEVCDSIAKSTGKLKKTKLLADYLQNLDQNELPIATVFLTGRPFGRADEIRALNVGYAVIRRALLAASGLTEAEYRRITQGQNDAGRAAHLALEGRVEGDGEPDSLAEIQALFRRLAETRGPTEKSKILSQQLQNSGYEEGTYVIQILTGDLRIGLKEGLVEDAIATAFEARAADVRRAHMLTGDLGETAVLAMEARLDSASLRPFTPIKVMLASPENTAEDIWKRLGDGEPGEVWLEDKFDGIRAQLHVSGGRVEIFSRDLRSLTGEFDELIEPAQSLPNDLILDGEIIAFAEGRKLTFFDLQKRLGRRSRNEGDLFLGPSVPVRFVAFDLLWLNGENMLDRPLRERRNHLDQQSLEPPFEIAAVRHASSPDEIESEFKAARLRENEGLIAKDPASVYAPGRRGLAWLKLKKPMATLDCVVVRAEQGHGKRSHVLSDYTFAVRDELSQQLLVIGKAYSGLTDAEIEELTEHFIERTISKKRRIHEVEPDIVLEIAFDSINPSKRHGSGLALRFPRIKAIRRDKTVADIDTLEFARRLAGQ
ncbi:MAG: ATP-dependent DNA ligase [Verrucomicrobiota bacterium]